MKKGFITAPLLIIVGAFIVVVYALLFMISLQLDFSHRQVASEQALHIAEAGINYYRWHLFESPADYQDGTNQAGPYIHDYRDSAGNVAGKFSLEITPPATPSDPITIRSTGWTENFPMVTRTIKAQFGNFSFTRYAILNNASSWYGPETLINGDIHSNNGIRMDGVNTGVVSSAKDTYRCGSETGCQPPQWKPGVWGTGGDQFLWNFPVPAVDFDAVVFDFNQLKEAAVSERLYLPPSNRYGYHLEFNSNGTVDVHTITRLNSIRGYFVPGNGLGEQGQGGCRNIPQEINREEFVGSFDLSDVPTIFAEDSVWVEGTVRGRTTVAAASFPLASGSENVWITGNLKYTTFDGSDALGLIAQNDAYFARDIPNEMQIDAALMSQDGNLMRHGYTNSCGPHSNSIRDRLTINGTLISFAVSYWNFGNPLESGFREVVINYDRNLLNTPPPNFPTSGALKLISWEEE